MELLKPVTFTSSMLTSSDATETIADYSAGTTYALDDEVNYANSIWVSLQASNTGNQPDTSPTWWIRKSANNKFSMFDEFINTQTTRTGSLQVVLQPGEMINAIGLFNLSGINSLHVVATNGVAGPEVFNQTYSLDDTIIVDWYMYFFEPYDLKGQFIVKGIPPYTNIVLTITFTSDTTVSVGNLSLGTTYNIGSTQYGVNTGIRDYSVKKVNDYGITTFVKRAFSNRMDVVLYVKKEDTNFVQKLLTDVRSTPCVWIGTEDDNYTGMTVYGYYKDFNVEIPYPSYSICRLEIEGLI